MHSIRGLGLQNAADYRKCSEINKYIAYYNKFLQILQQKLMEKQFVLSQQQRSKEKNRYSKYLRLNVRHEWGSQKDFYFDQSEQTLKLLQQILKLSQTKQGRARIYQIQSFIIEYYLIEAVKTKWRKSYGWRVDNLCLKILINLSKDPLFYKSAIGIKQYLCQAVRRVYSTNFCNLAGQVIKNINSALEELKQKQRQKIKNQYGGKMRFKEDQLDFMNFSGSWKFYEFYSDYIQTLIELLREDKKAFVKNLFPKGCFGCMVFSMVVSSNRAGQKQIGMKFLKEFTDGWFTSQLYDILLSYISRLYKYQLKYNHDLKDPYEIVCLRLHVSRTKYSCVYDYLYKVGRNFQEGKLHLLRRINCSQDFQEELEQFLAIQRKEQRDRKFEQQMRYICRNLKKEQKADRLFGVSQIVQGAAKEPFQEQLKKILVLGEKNFKSAQLKYIHRSQFKQVNIYKIMPRNFFFLAKLENKTIISGFSTYDSPQELKISNFSKKNIILFPNMYYSVSIKSIYGDKFYANNKEGDKQRQIFLQSLNSTERVNFKIEKEIFYLKPNWNKDVSQLKPGWKQLLQEFPENAVNQKLVQFKCINFEVYQIYF